MGLNSMGLDAFIVCAQEKNFTRASERLFITQSALSQRIKNLEEEFGATLFIRERIGVRITEAGEKLLRYCHQREQMEQELMGSVSDKSELTGILKIGGFSTVLRSVVLPALRDLAKKHSKVQLETMSREMNELPELLRNASVNFILLDHKIEREGIVALKLGTERNVRVRKKGSEFTGYFLDHDVDDETTLKYLKLKSGAKLKRHYLDEVYSTLDGALLGLGDAILPSHIISDVRGLDIIDRNQSLQIPVYLHYYEQAVQPRLEKLFIELIQATAKEVLEN